MSSPKSNTRPYSGWFWPYIKQQGLRLTAAIVFGTLAVACAAGLLFTSGYLISRSSLQPYNILMVYVPIVLVRTFGFGKAVIQYVERLISHDTVLRILSAMRVRLYNVLEPQAIHFRSRYQTGDVLAMLAEDIEQLQNVYIRLAIPSVLAVVIYGAGITALGLMDMKFAILMLLYCGFMMFTVPAYTFIRLRRLRKRRIHERNALYQELTDAVFGMSDWILSGRKEHLLESLKKKQSAMLSLEKTNRRLEWRMEWIMQCAVGGAVVLMTLWAGSLAAEGRWDPVWIAAYALVAFPLLEAMVSAGQAVTSAPDYKLSLERLANTEHNMEAANESESERAPASVELKELHKQIQHAAKMEQTGEQAAIRTALRLQNVSFRYTGSNKWSIQDLSLDIAPGSKIALIGRSGAGKSTLFKLLQCELKPTGGKILLNGMPINELDAAEYFSVFNQHPYLFDTTVANNIRLSRPEASLDEVAAAAEAAGLGQLLSSLPQGSSTLVREAGVRFSGGERQRIALARILLQNRPIVLLDEPTVGLDPITERDLTQTLLHALREKTVIWITHHLRSMEQMDQIVFMENGRITMQGTHAELLHSSERYRQLYALEQP